ncbi:hypothetical protein [Aquimarina sp. AU119]|nr:hypothetical protein [Aquimarina sp. AU119]
MKNIIQNQLTYEEELEAENLVSKLETIFIDKLSAQTKKERQDYIRFS